MSRLTRPELISYTEEEIKRLNKAVRDYPNHIGTEYLKGEIAAYKNILVKLTRDYEGR